MLGSTVAILKNLGFWIVPLLFSTSNLQMGYEERNFQD